MVRTIRILKHRYALTTTAHKYLEIGVSIGLASASIEIAIGDHQRNEIILPIESWRAFMEHRTDVLHFVQMAKPRSPTLWIHQIGFKIILLKTITVIQLIVSDSCLYMKPETLYTLFTFEDCIDSIYKSLTKDMNEITEKYRMFVGHVEDLQISDEFFAKKAIRELVIYDRDSIIDCELLTCAIGPILYQATCDFC